MKLTDLVVLVPCHTLEDFPTHHTGRAAEGLLAAWSAPWHPALLAAALKTPAWHRADDPPAPSAGMMIVVPTVVAAELPDDYRARAAEVNAALIDGIYERRPLVARALEILVKPSTSDAGSSETDSPGPSASNVDDDLAGDFLAVGVVYLLTELLTRRMRYMSNLDERAFQDHMLAAATAAVTGDEAQARDRLRRACETLYEARAHFYPVDSHLIDLTLVAQTTLGASLRDELAGSWPINLLASGEVLDAMADREPASIAIVRERLSTQTLSIVGGEHRETELPLLSLEAILGQLQAGHRAYEQHLGKRPEIFGRRRAGLTPTLPQILRSLGYKGALHFTLDEGRFPLGDRSKTLWEGMGAAAIDALARAPLDAGEAASVLTLAEKLGESMDHDFVSMVSFAHWPGLVSEYYEDLRRVSKYSPVLGKFITLDEFFASTESAGAFAKYRADEYRTPYLAQAVRANTENPLSAHVVAMHDQQLRSDTDTLLTWATLVGGNRANTTRDASDADTKGDPERVYSLAQGSLAAALGAAEVNKTASPETTGGVMYINPSSYLRRGGGGSPEAAYVDVPAFGFAWVAVDAANDKPSKSRKPIARELALVNELCEVTIHAETGGIRSIRDLHARGNRLSQQLAMRLGSPAPMPVGLWGDPDEGTKYSEMIADSIEITTNNALVGEITSRGRLVDNGRVLAGFVQTTRLHANRAVIELAIELETHEMPLADPWTSYYASRFAWSDDSAEIRRSLHGASIATELKRLEAPQFIEIVGGKSRTAILTGGLPYHRRIGPRMLDSFLVVQGETARRFRLAISLEDANPWRSAEEFIAPSITLRKPFLAPPAATSGWLFHLNSKQVSATHWDTLVEDQAVVGFRVRLLERGGQGGKAILRTFRDVASACHVNFNGEQVEELRVEGDRIHVEFAAHEWLEVAARWAG